MIVWYDLNCKTAVVSGASSGLGERSAITLSKAGARLILSTRRFDNIEALAQRLAKVYPLKIYISDESSVLDIFHKLEESSEKIDIC